MAHKHSEDSPCECEKLKDAERDTLREGLKKCIEAREAERTAREEELAQRAADAEAEVKSLKKKLLAFQLATAIGVALLGQEAFDRITAKMDAVQQVQDKITSGDATPPPAPTKPVAVGSPVNHRMPWRAWQKPRNADETQDHGNGDISGIFAGGHDTDSPPPLLPVSVTAPSPVDQAVKTLNSPLTVADMVSAVQPLDPYAFFLTPSALPFDVYSTTIGLGVNYGFGDYYGIDSGGAVVPPVPSPAPLTVFAVGGLMTSRKRA